MLNKFNKGDRVRYNDMKGTVVDTYIRNNRGQGNLYKVLMDDESMNLMWYREEELSTPIYDIEKPMLPKFTITVYSDEDENIRIVEAGENGKIGTYTFTGGPVCFEYGLHKALNNFLVNKGLKEDPEPKHNKLHEFLKKYTLKREELEYDKLYWTIDYDFHIGKYRIVPIIWHEDESDLFWLKTVGITATKKQAEELLEKWSAVSENF